MDVADVSRGHEANGEDVRLAHANPRPLPQLAVLAAAPIVAAELQGFLVVRLLARHAQSHAWHGVAPCLWDRGSTMLAVRCSRALGQAALSPADAVLHGRVDLILNCAVAGPTGRHLALLCHGPP